MKRRQRRLATIGVIASAVLMAAGCTGLELEEQRRAHRLDPEARPGGRLRIGISAPASVDPANVSDPSGALITSLICEPLLSLDPVTGRVAGGILSDFVVGGRGAQFTLQIRKGVRFHSGREVTAQDVAYALSRVARHDVVAPQADILRPIVGYDEIHAPPPVRQTGDPRKRTLAGAHTISRTALEIRLTEPNAEFLKAFALPLAAPVPKGVPDRDAGFAAQPDCVGPYQLARPYRADDAVIELHRDPKYYGRNDAYVSGGKGFADVIEFHVMADRDAQFRAFEAGTLDLAHVPAASIPRAQELDGSYQVAPQANVDFIGVAGTGPFDDVRVRRILSRSLDRAALVSAVYGGGRAPADRFLPTGLGDTPVPAACRQALPGDGAVGSLDDADAGLAALRGMPIEFKVNDDFLNLQLAEAVAGQWRDRLGLDIRPVAVSWDVYLTEVTSAVGVSGMFRESWEPAYASPDALLRPLFHTGEINHNNFARYSSRTFDRRIDRVARRDQDEETRLAKYGSLEEVVCRELPLIPVTFGQEEYVVQASRVATASGRMFEGASGFPLLREWFVRKTPSG